MDRVILEVVVGMEPRTFKIGDFLNAVDELVSYYQQHGPHEDGQYASALELYAKTLRGE